MFLLLIHHAAQAVLLCTIISWSVNFGDETSVKFILLNLSNYLIGVVWVFSSLLKVFHENLNMNDTKLAKGIISVWAYWHFYWHTAEKYSKNK